MPETSLFDGAQLRSIFVAAAHHLRDSAKAIDAINVYPVPDGDTGSNMSATLAEAVELTLTLGETPSVADFLNTLARGSLYGARGNSGVILSQALRGFAAGAGDRGLLDAAGLAAGLSAAAAGAYAAVGEPQEGTMLTVLRASALGAAAIARALPRGGQGAPCRAVLEAATAAAEEAEASTIDQLPALIAAGVTDAGGEGVCVIFRGLAAAIRGELPAQARVPVRPVASLSDHRAEAFGFCTEFMVEAAGEPVDASELRAIAEVDGHTSVVVVGDEQAMRVHVHTAEPQRLIDAARRLGQVTRVKVEDMGAQNRLYEATGTGASKRVALLAVSHGKGFDEIFQSLGASTTSLGEVTKPPAGAIAAAADALRTPDVIVLPNHRNVLLAAQQAAALASCTLHVMATETLPEGIAAAMAFSAAEGPARNLENMRFARVSLRTVEVTIAAATREADGVEARVGEAIALVDGRLIASTAEPVDALLAGLREAAASSAALVTIYGGERSTAGMLESARMRTADAFPQCEVEAVSGDQPLYLFIASVE